MIYRSFGGVVYRKSTRSGAGNDCLYADRELGTLADSKSGILLRGDVRQLAAFAKGR